MYEGATKTKFGRNHRIPKLDPERTLFHSTEQLKEVNWDIPIPVLDQEDLFKQDIEVSQFIPRAVAVDALGSCTAQSSTAHTAQMSVAAGKDLESLEVGFGGKVWRMAPSSASNSAVVNEKWAIVFYHVDTDQTNNPSTEWPPTDCGSDGESCCQMLVKQGLAKNFIVPTNIQGALLALQKGTVMQGAPWFNAWMSPDSDGFVDGDGSVEALKAAIQSGVAGGHETTQRAIVQLAQTKVGAIDLEKTVIKIRNSWSEQFGLQGDYLIHASTLDLLGHYVDYKQLVI